MANNNLVYIEQNNPGGAKAYVDSLYERAAAGKEENIVQRVQNELSRLDLPYNPPATEKKQDTVVIGGKEYVTSPFAPKDGVFSGTIGNSQPSDFTWLKDLVNNIKNPLPGSFLDQPVFGGLKEPYKDYNNDEKPDEPDYESWLKYGVIGILVLTVLSFVMGLFKK